MLRSSYGSIGWSNVRPQLTQSTMSGSSRTCNGMQTPSAREAVSTFNASAFYRDRSDRIAAGRCSSITLARSAAIPPR